MRVLVMDQDGGIRSIRSGKRLENLGIIRRLKGSTVAGEHTATGLAESHVRLSKLTMLKIHAAAKKAGLLVEDEDIGFETGMAHNCVLSFGGVSPNMAALGQHPHGHYEFEDSSVTGIEAGGQNSHDIFEGAVRLRLVGTRTNSESHH